MLLHITVLLFLYQSDAFFTSYVFETSLTSTGFNVEYLFKNLEFGSAFRQGLSSGIVEKLPAEWNNNRTFESGYMFAWMRWFETPFEEATLKNLPLPENFGVGCRIDVVVKTTDVIGNGFYVSIDSADKTVRYVHLSVRPTMGHAILNTKVNGTWLDEVQIPIDGFVNSTNTVYTSTFYLLSTHWEVYTDDVFLGNFTHVNAFNGTGIIKADSDDVLCKRIIFYGP